jgi:hypothetical protein
VPNPAQPPDLTAINGYIGPSDDPTAVRVYRTAQMNTWLDIPAAQIVLRRKIKRDSTAPWGKDVVWVTSRDARRLVPETSAAGAHPGPAGRPPIGIGAMAANDPGPAARTCPCCGRELSRPMPGPIGGGGDTGPGNMWQPPPPLT